MISHQTISTSTSIPPSAVFTGIPVLPVLHNNSDRTARPTSSTLVVPHLPEENTPSLFNSTASMQEKSKTYKIRLYARMFGMTMGFFTVAATMAPQLPLLLYASSHYPTTSMSVTGTIATDMTYVPGTSTTGMVDIGMPIVLQTSVAIWLGLWCILVCTMFYAILSLVSVMIKMAHTSRHRNCGNDDLNMIVMHHHDDDDDHPWVMIVEREGMTWCLVGIICFYTIMDVCFLPRPTPYLLIGLFYVLIVIAFFELHGRYCMITQQEHDDDAGIHFEIVNQDDDDKNNDGHGYQQFMIV